jgi:TRAP-type mannitol/chloroaromatic compound transport system permease large subunit
MANVTHTKARLRVREIMEFMKFIVAIAFLAILVSLGSALVFMMRDGRNGQAKSSNMVKALSLRVGFSILIFVFILIGWKLGYIQPTGIKAGQ